MLFLTCFNLKLFKFFYFTLINNWLTQNMIIERQWRKDEPILKLNSNQIFVFGSNLAGRHGAGAALAAKKHFNAKYGCGVGITGQCYAIPTKDKKIKTLPLNEIKGFVDDFIAFAKQNSHLEFLVTPIGCGLAGYSVKEIAPLFENSPQNCILPDIFKPFLRLEPIHSECAKLKP